MPEVQISCAADISNVFARGQHDLDKTFDMIDGINSTFMELVPDGGAFPVGSGFAARTTWMGQQRLAFSRLNIFQPMVGMQPDCETSCDPPVERLNLGNSDNQWYRLMNGAFNTDPYCLETMWGDALNLSENVENIYRNLKHVTNDVYDEFSRNNHAGLSQYRWMGYVEPSDGTQKLLRQQWRFATDANGNVDTTYIILDATVNPNNISLLSVGGLLNRVRNDGMYIGTFPKDGEIPLVADYQTFSDLPLYDTNVRADNRFRQPTVLNPAYADTTRYGGFTLRNDPFGLRYRWTTSDPLYPSGVLKRVDQWSNQAMTQGCTSILSPEYDDADFMVSFPWGGSAFTMQNGMQPTSAPGGVNFAASAAPWRGAWRWVNEINEITPCNVDRNKGFWRSVWKLAAKPRYGGQRGNAILHRRFPYTGVTSVCRPLNTATNGSVDCGPLCSPLDWSPPALVDVFTCGQWNDASCGS
jgi:hypothetical protein